ncbi:hypothetical protein [Thiohalocapsa marina]|uniref:hypothetical protein n=1 Tax=Thiohalocapsa marina TaxID=424902 RepID=UPI0036D7DE04
MSDIKPALRETFEAALDCASTEPDITTRARTFVAALSGGLRIHDPDLADQVWALLEPRQEDRQ